MNYQIRRCWKCFRLTDRWEIRQIQNPDRSYTAAVCQRCLTNLPTSPTEKPMEPDPRPIADRVEGAIARLQERRQPFSMKDVEQEAGIPNGTLYKTVHVALKLRVRRAEGYKKGLRSGYRKIAPDLELPPLEAHLKKFAPQIKASELHQRIDDLEARNRELREQLAQSQPQIIQIAPLAWLEREVEHWRSRTSRLDEQICQLQEDLDSARRNLESCELILRLSREAIEGAEVVTSNGVAHARA